MILAERCISIVVAVNRDHQVIGIVSERDIIRHLSTGGKSAAKALATSTNAAPIANGEAPANPPFKLRASIATHTRSGVRNSKNSAAP